MGDLAQSIEAFFINPVIIYNSVIVQQMRISARVCNVNPIIINFCLMEVQ